MVVETKSSVVYFIHPECGRKLQVVHFNRLKSCHSPPELVVSGEMSKPSADAVSQQSVGDEPEDTHKVQQQSSANLRFLSKMKMTIKTVHLAGLL